MPAPRFSAITDELRQGGNNARLTIETGFDEIMDPREQERWLRDPAFVDARGERVDDFPLRLKYGVRFDSIRKMPNHEQAVAVTRQTVQTCIPAFVRSEQAYWNVTGRPGGKWAVLRVNMNWQIVYDVFTDWQGGFVYRWFLWREQLAEIFTSPLLADYTPVHAVPFSIYDRQVPPEPLELTLGSGHSIVCDWLTSGLVAGGADQIVLRVFSAEDAHHLLNDPAMIRAARSFALNLARMGKTPYGRYHCFDLADHLVEPEDPCNEG